MDLSLSTTGRFHLRNSALKSNISIKLKGCKSMKQVDKIPCCAMCWSVVPSHTHFIFVMFQLLVEKIAGTSSSTVTSSR